MRKISMATIVFFMFSGLPVCAQQIPDAGTVVANCGALPSGVTYGAGQVRSITVDINGNGCNSLSGGPTGASSSDISGTIASGGSYQTAAAANSNRKNCTLENPTTATEPLFIKFGTMAQPYSLNAGQAISALNGVVVATDAITVSATTTNHSYSGTCQ